MVTESPNRDRMLQFSSGGWVLVASVVLTLGALAWFLVPVWTGGGSPAPVELPDRGFTLQPTVLPEGALVASDLPRDGLMTLDAPETISAADADAINELERGKFLVSGDWVIGVQVGDASRAYPLRMMNWHEIVNDTLDGRAIAVTYSPLSGSARVFEREIGGTVREFGVSGLLYNSSLVFYDRTHPPGGESLWSQLQGRAVAGPAAGDPLRGVPCSLTTWGAWRHHAPETTVLRPVQSLKRLYKRNPYGAYLRTGQLKYPVDPMPPPEGLPAMTPVAILRGPGGAVVVPLARDVGATAEIAPPLSDDLRAHVDFARSEDRYGLLLENPDDIGDVFYAAWFGWYSTHADDPGVVVRRPDTAP